MADAADAPLPTAGSFTAHAALCHNNLLYCAAGRAVRVHSNSTLELLTELAHPAAVSGVAISPVNSMQLLTACADGLLRSWDIEDGALLQEWKASEEQWPIVYLCRDAPTSTKVVLVCEKKAADGQATKKRARQHVIMLDLRKGATTTLTKDHLNLRAGVVCGSSGAGGRGWLTWAALEQRSKKVSGCCCCCSCWWWWWWWWCGCCWCCCCSRCW